MAEVYRALEEADALIVATPVYFASVPSTLKALYDRCQPYWARRYVLGEPPREQKRPAGLLLVGGGGDPFGSDCAVTTTRSVLAVLGARLLEKVVADRVDARGEIEAHADILDACTSLGARLTRDAANLS
jgi:multimeric flavodoxin WrbA